jgi:hypothetical protein
MGLGDCLSASARKRSWKNDLKYRLPDRIETKSNLVYSILASDVYQASCPAPRDSPGSRSILFVQDYAEEATVHCQSAIVVINKAKASELVHEMTDP